MQRVGLIDGQLYIGSVFDIIEMKTRAQKFDLIWNLAEELEEYIEFEKSCTDIVLSGMISDFSIPKDEDKFKVQLDQVIDFLNHGRKVLIHCMGGHGRTGMVLGLLFLKMNGTSPPQAISQARSLCDGPESKMQEAFILKFR